MPRSRATELPQRPSPRAPPSLRTSSSDSDPTQHRSRTTERSPKLSDGRSPRAVHSDQRKLGSRIADLESQLGQAQEELKSLKGQLSSAEAAKKAAQEQLQKKSRKVKRAPSSVEVQEKDKHTNIVQNQESSMKQSNDDSGTSDDTQKETDVFEVPVENKSVCLPTETPPTESLSFDELGFKNDEIGVLQSNLDEKNKELQLLLEENVKMKSQLHEQLLKMSSAEIQIEELSLKLEQANEELEKSKTSEAQMNEKLGGSEKAREELENEMKMLRIQTEQWRKAADAAATVLAGEVKMNGRRISERCGSMDKHYGSAFEPAGAYAEDSDDVYGGGKRKGSGIKMFGDLWRKKGNK